MDDEEESIRKVREVFGAPEKSLTEAAIHLHELHESFVEGGFTERQSLYIIAMGMFGKPAEE